MVESVSNNIQSQQLLHQTSSLDAKTGQQLSIDAEASRLAQEINNNTLQKQKALRSQIMNAGPTTSGKRTFGGLANNANILNPTGASSKDLPMKRSYEDQENKENNANNAPAKVLWDDLDAEDLDDPLMVAEYVEDIIKYMRQLEVSRANFTHRSLLLQCRITWTVKRTLIGACAPFWWTGWLKSSGD